MSNIYTLGKIIMSSGTDGFTSPPKDAVNKHPVLGGYRLQGRKKMLVVFI